MTQRLKLSQNKSSEDEKPSVNPEIIVITNGPYLVLGKVPIVERTIACETDGTSTEWRGGAEYPMKDQCQLCRCGHTKNKPYCDGTHTKVGFDGTESAGEEGYLDESNVINGPTLKLNDLEILCASARFCHRAGGIWKLIPKTDEPEARKAAIEEACDCPSGRLVVTDKITNKIVEPKLEKSIALIEDPWVGVSGPLWVRGSIPVQAADGKIYRVRNRVTLCRCGKSTNKPFCDSSHYPEAAEVEKVHR